MLRLLLITFINLMLLLGCDDSESLRVKDTTEKLVGTWVREEPEDTKAQRVLILNADGKFVEKMVVLRPGQSPERMEFAGEWSYDGTNLKRRFLQENGRQYSGGGMRFATFPLLSVNSAEFVVDDRIGKKKVTYRRTGDASR